MFESILELIKKYDTVIIHRHKKPDGDAIGSQVGLKHIITANFPEKIVYTVGDPAGRYAFIEDSTTDVIDDSVYENEVSVPSPEGVVLRNRTDLRLKILLKDNAAIQALFAMTPYVRKTSPDDIAKLNSLSTLETTAAFSLLLYQKKDR